MIKFLAKNICVTYSSLNFDPSNSNYLLGYRAKTGFKVLKPSVTLSHLKLLLTFLESLLNNQYRIIFISGLSNPILKKNFSYIVKRSNHDFCQDIRNLHKRKGKFIIVSLFLDSEDYFSLSKECNRFSLPLIGISDLDSSSSHSQGMTFIGSIQTFETQVYLLNLFSILLLKNLKNV